MRNSRFITGRSQAMKKFESALSNFEVDEILVPLLRYVNSRDNFYTTSSCAGRITLFWDIGSKLKNDFMGKWHREVTFEEVKEQVAGIDKKDGIVWFRQESMIFHIVGRTLDDAVVVLNIALKSGLKHSGVQVFKQGRYLVEICGAERMDVPVIDSGILLIDDNYLEYLINLANRKLRETRRRLEKFEVNFKRAVSNEE